MKMAGNNVFKRVIIWVVFLSSGWLFSYSTAPASENQSLCNAVPFEKAAKILLTKESDLEKNTRELMVSPEDIKNKLYLEPPVSCSIRSKSNFLKTITFVSYVFNDPSRATLELKKMKQGFETVAKTETIIDMGDEAFWVKDARFQRLMARKNNRIIDILNPKEFNHQADIMKMILDKL